MFLSWKTVRVVLKAILVSVVLCTLAFGIIGFLLAGLAGMLNLAAWGVAFGLFGGTLTAGMMMTAKLQHEVGGNFSRWVEEQEAKGNHKS